MHHLDEYYYFYFSDDGDNYYYYNNNKNTTIRDVKKERRSTANIKNALSSSTSLLKKNTFQQKQKHFKREDNNNNNINVFIAIKTTQTGPHHKQRRFEIQDTWLQDALNMNGIHVTFFAGKKENEEAEGGDEEYRRIKTTATTKAEMMNTSKTLLGTRYNGQPQQVRRQKQLQQQEQEQNRKQGEVHIVYTTCNDNDICCKTAETFSYFLKYYNNGGMNGDDVNSNNNSNGDGLFYCSFDDDNYVLVHNLLNVLRAYHNNQNKKHQSDDDAHEQGKGPDNDGNNLFYIGKRSLPNGIKLYFKNVTTQFLTGGAGYCLSYELVKLGEIYFTSLPQICRNELHITRGDDVAVGYIVQEKLSVTFIEDELFHSHLEYGLGYRLKSFDDISKQISFGFDNKSRTCRGQPKNCFPSVPMIYPTNEMMDAKDPLMFRSLHCFLIQEEKRRNSSGSEVVNYRTTHHHGVDYC